MNFRVWLKSRAADKLLSPVRDELVNLVKPGSSLLDIGSGTGDLLFKCAPRLAKGLGVDIDEGMVTFAQEKQRTNGATNIEFSCRDIRNMAKERFDVSTSTLCLHAVGIDTACEIMEIMLNRSAKVLIADYTRANNLSARAAIELDEIFSGHYANYRQYRKCGGIPHYADLTDAYIRQTIRSKIDGISIWVIDGKHAYS